MYNYIFRDYDTSFISHLRVRHRNNKVFNNITYVSLAIHGYIGIKFKGMTRYKYSSVLHRYNYVYDYYVYE